MRERPIQRTYDSNNNLVYCISQNQVLGQGININVLLYTFPSVLYMLTKGLDWLKWDKNRWWWKSGGGGLWFKATPFIFTAGNVFCLKLCFYFCWIINVVNGKRAKMWSTLSQEDPRLIEGKIVKFKGTGAWWGNVPVFGVRSVQNIFISMISSNTRLIQHFWDNLLVDFNKSNSFFFNFYFPECLLGRHIYIHFWFA